MQRGGRVWKKEDGQRGREIVEGRGTVRKGVGERVGKRRRGRVRESGEGKRKQGMEGGRPRDRKNLSLLPCVFHFP